MVGPLACVTKRAKSVISQDVVSNGYFGKKNKSIYFLIARFLLKIVLEERCGWYVLLSSVLSPVVGIYLQQGWPGLHRRRRQDQNCSSCTYQLLYRQTPIKWPSIKWPPPIRLTVIKVPKVLSLYYAVNFSDTFISRNLDSHSSRFCETFAFWNTLISRNWHIVSHTIFSACYVLDTYCSRHFNFATFFKSRNSRVAIISCYKVYLAATSIKRPWPILIWPGR